MIPKKIHYCWFGGNHLPEDVKLYIASWRKYCPDYEIIEWNESNFDINCCAYVKEAYEAKKWAFVTDYVRLYALYHHGGIYMDTDVEVVKPFDDLLDCQAFMCFENDRLVSIGTFGAIKNSTLIREFLDSYGRKHFLKEEGRYDITTNLHVVTSVLRRKYNLRLNGKAQLLKGKICIYPMDYFIAKSYRLGWIQKSECTYAIHHYNASWVDEKVKNTEKKKRKYAILYMRCLEKYVFKFAGVRVTFDDEGFLGIFKKIINKMII